jgi:hypothetical protein
VHGKRVVLEYRLGDTTVRESPWWTKGDRAALFTRAFEVDKHDAALRLKLLDARGAGVVARISDPPATTFRLDKDGRTSAIVCTGPGYFELDKQSGSLELVLPPATQIHQFKIVAWTGTAEEQPGFSALALAPAVEVTNLRQPGPARWLPVLKTSGQVAPDTGPLAIDTLTVPYDNPWNALMFLSGVDFTSDGTAYVCSIHGDVWKVSGVDDRLSNLSWKRFATGLYQPLGLKVVNDQVYVLGRDQITRLHDENTDGEADFYEDFCNLIRTSPDPHNYVTSLEADAAGNFYYADPRGVHRVSPDGRRAETLAMGFRNPNGLGASPDGNIVTVAPQQGEWTPSSSIIEAKRGGYYGYGGPRVTAERPLGYDPVLCWIPHSVDNSGGSEVWVPQSRAGVPPALAQPRPGAAGDWGPLSGQLLHFSWGRCSMMLVLRDVVDGVAQGATVALPGRFLSGAMRGAFNPRDGHLYVVGSTGWQTSALKDGCLQRVRYTGKPLDVPVAWHAQHNGLRLMFTQPLEKETAEDVGSYGVEQWNYRYAAQYGSKDWSVANPQKEGHDTLDVRSAKLLADGRTVFLEIPGLKPVMQLQLQYNLNAKDGASLRGKLYATINRLPLATSSDRR